MNYRYSILLVFVLLANHVYSQSQSNSISRNDSSIEITMLYNNVVKLNIFPMIGGRLNLAFELGNNAKTGYEVSFEGVGFFTNDQDKPYGFMGQLGYRLYSKSKDLEQAHPKSALFFMPAIKIGYVHYYEYSTIYDALGAKTLLKNNVNTNYCLPTFNVGRQFVLHKRFSLDLVAGLGLLIRSKTNNLYLRQEAYSPVQDPFKYGFVQAAYDFPLVASATVRFGYLFN